eukprot:g56776.t1
MEHPESDSSLPCLQDCELQTLLMTFTWQSRSTLISFVSLSNTQSCYDNPKARNGHVNIAKKEWLNGYREKYCLTEKNELKIR